MKAVAYKEREVPVSMAERGEVAVASFAHYQQGNDQRTGCGRYRMTKVRGGRRYGGKAKSIQDGTG